MNNKKSIRVIFAVALFLFNNSTEMFSQKPELKLNAQVVGDILSKDGFRVALFNNDSETEEKNFKVKFFIVKLLSLADGDEKELGGFISDKDIMKSQTYLEFISELAAGDYKIIISSIICGPANKENDDLNSFRPYDVIYFIKIAD